MPCAVIELDASNRIKLVIDGRERVLDVDADTSAGDLDEDMASVAGLIGWYTQVLAAARRHCDVAEAQCKAWQARTLREYLADEPRLAEWKAKAAMNSEPEFLTHKMIQADAWQLANRLDGAVKALSIKADMMRSRGAMIRTEINHLDRSIAGPTDESVEGKGERLKSRLKSD